MALSDSFVKKEYTAAQLAALEYEEEQKRALLEEMGLDGHQDVEYLRRQQLSHEEAVIAKQEELDKIRRHKGQKDSYEEFIDLKRRLGRIMHHSEFIRRLRKVIPNLIVARGGVKGDIGLYVSRTIPREEITDYIGDWAYVEAPIYVGYLDEGFMPEYEVDFTNDVGVAVAKWRGWRTILLNLYCRRYRCEKCRQGEFPKPLPCGFQDRQCGHQTSLINGEDLEKEFGYPTNGTTASWYRKKLWEFANAVR